jgi:hypothetical protein
MLVVLGAVVGSTFALQVAAGELTSTPMASATQGVMRLDVGIGPAWHQVTAGDLHRPATQTDRSRFGAVHRSASSSPALGLTGADVMALGMTALALCAFSFLVVTFTRRRTALP